MKKLFMYVPITDFILLLQMPHRHHRHTVSHPQSSAPSTLTTTFCRQQERHPEANVDVDEVGEVEEVVDLPKNPALRNHRKCIHSL